MKKLILPLILLVGAGSIIAFNSPLTEEENTQDIALAATSERGEIHTISSVSKPVKDQAVNFTWVDVTGKTVSFKDYTNGKVVFLNFWGTWCPPCRREIPDIVTISNELKDKDFVVIGIALERGNNPEKKLEAFMEANGIKYHNFLADKSLTEAYGGISSVPTTFIIDKNGKIVEKIVGMQTKEKFMQSINKVLD